MEVKYLDFIFQHEISRIWYKNTVFMIDSVLYCLFNIFGITLKSLKTKSNSHFKNHGGLDNQRSQRSNILDFWIFRTLLCTIAINKLFE
jgi:hypothetical protein